MISCILCLGGTRESKLVKLSELVDAKLTLEDAIKQQIPNSETFLSNPISSPFTCTTCYRTFKSFYSLLTKINENQSLKLETSIKTEVEEELNISSFISDEPQIEIEQLNCDIKVEPEFITEDTEVISKPSQHDDDFEWEMDDSEFFDDNADPDYDIESEKVKKSTKYVRYLKRHEVTQEMLDSGMNYVTIDGLEYKIPRKQIRKLKRPDKPEPRVPTTRNTPIGDERVRQFMDIKCELCGADFTTFFRLGKHFRRFHPETSAFLRCCDRKFYRRLTLLDHLDSHDDSVIHECPECHKHYKTDKILKMHFDKIHKNKYQECICNICGRTLKSQGALNKHLYVHEEDTRQFECYICKKSI